MNLLVKVLVGWALLSLPVTLLFMWAIKHSSGELGHPKPPPENQAPRVCPDPPAWYQGRSPSMYPTDTRRPHVRAARRR